MAHNGPIIRPLNLDFDLERSYFKSMIVRSPLVKDATIRKEMLMILKNPEQPGNFFSYSHSVAEVEIFVGR